ncbi:MAG: aspartate aminotransferase family protein [Armatimonadetes bacterium]|nr:MAG: aspartate aminotransferase family protein [Armatimonadota bacterium]
MDIETILTKQEESLWGVSNYYQRPISLARGKGVYVWDTEGNKYLDMFGGMLTLSTGHCHPKVTAAITEQVEKLIFAPSLYPHENAVAYAEKLSEILPPSLSKMYFSLSGTDAVENAVKLAKQHTGAQEVIAIRGAYHGLSALGMSLTAHPTFRLGGTHITGIKHAPQPNCYRCALRLTYPSCEVACATDIEEIIQKTTSGRIAAIIAEPIAGVSGLITPPLEYFKTAVDIVREHGGLFIADEVQTMFGRTGKYWAGHEHWGVTPDIMAVGKSIASGMPLSATITTPEIAASLGGSIISTFQSHPVSVAAADATLDVLKEEAPPSHVEKIGHQIREGFELLKDEFPLVGDVRGMGCMQGIEFVKDRDTKEPANEAVSALFEATRERGLLVGSGGTGNAFRFTPPLTVTESEIEEALSILHDSIAEVQATVS